MRTSSAKPNFLPFLSTPSARRATVRCGLLPPTRYDFYPRPPRGGRPGQRHCADHLQNFYPRPPRGGRPATALHRGKAAVFLSTPSARRATLVAEPRGWRFVISIPARRVEGDVRLPVVVSFPLLFLSTPSARRATMGVLIRMRPFNYFYPRPPRGGRHLLPFFVWIITVISIHALREEGDPRSSVVFAHKAFISIHALREEGDPPL